MAYTYSPGDSDRDRVRFRIADNVSGSMILQDAEIDDLLLNFPYNEACAQACESIGLYYSRKADEFSEAQVKRSYKQRAQNYLAMADKIRSEGQQPGGPVRTGAASAQMEVPDLSNYRTT